MSQETGLIKVQEAMAAEITPFQAKSNSLLSEATQHEVTDDTSLATAVSIKKAITAHRTMVKDVRLSITRRIDDLKKAIMNKEDEVLLPLEKAQNLLGEKILTYQEEQERIRREEQERIDKVIARVTVGDTYRFKEPDAVQDEGERLKKVYSELPEADQKNSDVKLAFTQSVNKLADRKAYLEEQIAQEKERARLAAEAKKQSDERAELERKKAEAAEKERKIKAEQERLEREAERRAAEEQAEEERKKKERDERTSVKTGVRTVTTFEVTNPTLVPREYCSPDEKLIRAAIKEGVEVPGVEVTVTKKV